MTYGFNDFIWLLGISWLIVYLIHQVIGGLLALIPGIKQRKPIEIVNTWNKPA
jgi:hypothetical protein